MSGRNNKGDLTNAMCGILALLGPKPDDRFEQALELLAHRGPDGRGIWQQAGVQIGHRRLSIIDLSRDADQPMVDDGLVISYNGEIYNYLELRAELEAAGHSFRTRSDTEVLLKAWRQWGPAMAQRLNGMWAILLWDQRQRQLYLSRDRFGVKPLYYALDRGRLLVASEPRAILALAPHLAEPNPNALYDLFTASRGILGEQTFFKSILSLKPAHQLLVGPAADGTIGSITPAPYWHYPEPETGNLGVRESEQQFAALFSDAVRLRLRSDVPVGLTLSGGIDSTAVLAAVNDTGAGALHCFTSVYDGNERGEEKWAQKAAAVGNHPLHSIEAPGEAWLATLDRIIWHLDGPNQSSAVYPLWAIARAARTAGVPVLLEGQGADELLGGYAQYMPLQSRHLVKTLLMGKSGPGELVANWRGAVQTFGQQWALLWHLRAGVEPAYRYAQRHIGRGKLFRSDMAAMHGLSMALPQSRKRRGGLFHRMLADHARDVLPSLLHYGDAVSMAHGIETRLPFMDYRLVEWVFRAQPELIAQGRTKWPVRRYLESHGHGEIAARQDKLGYPTPVRQWLVQHREFIETGMLGNANAALWNYFDRKAVSAAFADLLRGNGAESFHFYKFVPTHLWLEQLRRQAFLSRPA